MALLVLAGLLRPEAWVLAGLFALWRRSAALLAAAAIAPVLWALDDLVVTGDPLRSLTGTSELAEELGRERGIAKVPGAFVEFVADALRLPVAAAALAGLALALAAARAGGGSSSRSACSRPGRSRSSAPASPACRSCRAT